MHTDYVLDNGKVREMKVGDNQDKSIIYLGSFYWLEEAVDYAKECRYIK